MGRPRKYKKPEDMQVKIDEYFKIHDGGILSLGGLCNHLDLTYEGFAEYGRRKSYSGIVKKAKQKIETWIFETGMKGDVNPAMAIFYLKANCRWSEKAAERTTEHQEPIPVKINISVEDAS